MEELGIVSPEKSLVFWESYEKIQLADPLGFDHHVEDLVIYNRTGNINATKMLLYEAIDKTHKVLATLDIPAATACLRDIDFLISSLVAHGAYPFEHGDDIERVLLSLAAITGTVPRGTSFTYANGNPEGSRRRSFTGDEKEYIFIDAIAKSNAAMSRSLRVLSNLPNPITNISTLIDPIHTTTSSMISVKRAVTPDFFTKQLRPYLELWTVEGKDYFGPGGFQTLLPADLILWGVDETHDIWVEFVATNYPYLDQQQKKDLDIILEKMRGKGAYAHALDSNDSNIQKDVCACLQALKKFRYPHRKLVLDNVVIAEDDDTYADSIVEVLLKKTTALTKNLEERLQV